MSDDRLVVSAERVEGATVFRVVLAGKPVFTRTLVGRMGITESAEVVEALMREFVDFERQAIKDYLDGTAPAGATPPTGVLNPSSTQDHA